MQRLKHMRASKKITQADMAAYLKIDRTTYAKYESGSSDPPTSTLIRLAEYFGVTVDYLIEADTIQDSENDSESTQTAISIFKSIPESKKQAALDYLKFLASQK